MIENESPSFLPLPCKFRKNFRSCRNSIYLRIEKIRKTVLEFGESRCDFMFTCPSCYCTRARAWHTLWYVKRRSKKTKQHRAKSSYFLSPQHHHFYFYYQNVIIFIEIYKPTKKKYRFWVLGEFEPMNDKHLELVGIKTSTIHAFFFKTRLQTPAFDSYLNMSNGMNSHFDISSVCWQTRHRVHE